MQDARTGEVVRKVLAHEKSQLVVLNGDLVTGATTQADNVTAYVDQVLQPVIDSGLPWATTYGNHDHQSYSKPEELFKHEQRYKKSLTQNMLPNNSNAGVSNYYLLVYPASGNQTVPDLILWFFDSRGGNFHDGSKRPDWVDESVGIKTLPFMFRPNILTLTSQVVTWFVEANKKLTQEYKKVIPSLAFYHIPISATFKFQKDPGVNPSTEPGINGEQVVWQGEMYDKKLDHDLEFMEALSNTSGLLATFSGHDHDNDWYVVSGFNTSRKKTGLLTDIPLPRCYKWKPKDPGHDVNICYGRHTGYGGYGDLDRGGRQILLKKPTLDKEAITWIRLEDGRVPENVTLNSTYGHDQYHPIHHSPDLAQVSLELKARDFEGAGNSLQAAPGLSLAFNLSLNLYAALFLFVLGFIAR